MSPCDAASGMANCSSPGTNRIDCGNTAADADKGSSRGEKPPPSLKLKYMSRTKHGVFAWTEPGLGFSAQVVDAGPHMAIRSCGLRKIPRWSSETAVLGGSSVKY